MGQIGTNNNHYRKNGILKFSLSLKNAGRGNYKMVLVLYSRLFEILIYSVAEGSKKFILSISLLVEHYDKRKISVMVDEKTGITEYVSESATL